MSDVIPVVIVGGGPIGCALAVALHDLGTRSLVLEARAAHGTPRDGRTLALTYGSRLILERAGAWSNLSPVTPITSIHVSQRGGLGRTLLCADELELPALGYVVPFAQVHQALRDRLQTSAVEVQHEVRVHALEPGPDAVTVHCAGPEGERRVMARLAIVADGTAELGRQAGADYVTRDYGQSAVVARVTTSLPHDYRAYERFTADGPVALLPAQDHYALVWSCRPKLAPALLEQTDERFLAQLQDHFGDRAGRFLAVRDRASFGLTLRFARNVVRPRTVLVGNSAQLLHPIAGQGFNLGLRDAWALATLLAPADDPGAREVLDRYARLRRPDRFAGVAATDLLTRLFSHSFPLLSPLRGAAMAGLDVVPPARRFLMRRMIFGSFA